MEEWKGYHMLDALTKTIKIDVKRGSDLFLCDLPSGYD